MYRLEVHHTTHWDGIPVEEIEQRKQNAFAQPWWKRVLGGSWKVRGSRLLSIASSRWTAPSTHLPGAAAAVALAEELTGVIRDDSAVVIIREADYELVDGIYPNNGGRF